MPKTQISPKNHFTLFSVLNKIVGIATGTGPFLELIGELMEKQVDKLLRRMMGLAVVYLTMFAGIIILAIGISLLIIDFTAIPRGVVFTVGGLFIVIVSALFIQLSRK
jgi:hypothetical protein